MVLESKSAKQLYGYGRTGKIYQELSLEKMKRNSFKYLTNWIFEKLITDNL
jgi:hypothetical protein